MGNNAHTRDILNAKKSNIFNVCDKSFTQKEAKQSNYMYIYKAL